MTLLMYAIADAEVAETVDGVGLDASPLRGLREGELIAVVSEFEPGDLEPSAERLWSYEQVVERLMEDHAILPARFGSTFDDEGGVHELIRGRRGELLAAVERVRGAVELGLRARWTEAIEPVSDYAAQSGTAYMLGRLDLRRHARTVAARLTPLSDLARDCVQRVLPRPTLPFVGCYLVDRERTAEFTELVERMDRDLDQVELVCTGPWPPYTFAEGATG